MRNSVKKRTDFTGSVESLRRHRTIVAITLIMWFATRSLALDARDQKQAQPQGAPPDLQITQVKALRASTASATTDVEIRWTAQVPRLTTIDGFDVTLEVRYGDGSKNVARGEQLRASARSAILPVAAHPRPNSNATVKNFKVTVKARFKIASSVTVAQQVNTTQGNSFRAMAGSSNASQPEVFITAAKFVAQGCPQGQQCVEVKWTAVAPRNITISEFTVSVDALHKNGTRRADSKTMSGTDRQARLLAGASGSEIESLKLSLLTSFSLMDSKIVVKEGALAQDSAETQERVGR
jgi:hypothetical protein